LSRVLLTAVRVQIPAAGQLQVDGARLEVHLEFPLLALGHQHGCTLLVSDFEDDAQQLPPLDSSHEDVEVTAGQLSIPAEGGVQAGLHPGFHIPGVSPIASILARGGRGREDGDNRYSDELRRSSHGHLLTGEKGPRWPASAAGVAGSVPPRGWQGNATRR